MADGAKDGTDTSVGSRQGRSGQVRPRIATDIILIIIIFLLQTRNYRSQHHGEQRCQMLTELTEQTELPGRGVCWLVDLPGGWLRKRLLRLSQRLWLADASRQKPSVLVCAESVYRERVTKVFRTLTYVGRQGSDLSEYIFSCIYRIR